MRTTRQLRTLIQSISAQGAALRLTLRLNEDCTKIIRIDGDWNQIGEYVAVSLHPETK